MEKRKQDSVRTIHDLDGELPTTYQAVKETLKSSLIWSLCPSLGKQSLRTWDLYHTLGR